MTVVWTIAAAWLSLALVAALPTPTLAAPPTSVGLFDPRGTRAGFAIVEGDRVDLCDLRSNRTGSGSIEDRRRLEFFDTESSRTGYATTEGDRLDFLDVRKSRTDPGRIRGCEGETSDRQGNRTGLGRWPQARVK